MISIFVNQDEQTHEIQMILETEFDGQKYGVHQTCQNDLKEFSMFLSHATEELNMRIENERNEKYENESRKSYL